MYLFAEVIFYSGQRKYLPTNGYRPDAVFDGRKDYWGITFVELPVEEFDAPVPAIIKFTFQNTHYQDVMQGQSFAIMEGSHQVGEGKIISIEK
ncbi:MAG: hypothetical protein NC517_10915 [Firmicutes bacterium]|nr:hypothetical protein [Bacillota bacterium]